MNDKQLDIAYFIAFCVEQYKAQKGMSGAEVMNLFHLYGVDEYLERCYEPLHTQGARWLMAEIDEFIDMQKKEVVL